MFFYLSWPLFIPNCHIRHFLNLAFMTILEFTIQLATTLGFEDCSLPPIWFFSINFISVLAFIALSGNTATMPKTLLLMTGPRMLSWLGVSLQSCRSLAVSGSYCLLITEIPRGLCKQWSINWYFGQEENKQGWVNVLKYLHLFLKKQITLDYYLSQSL